MLCSLVNEIMYSWMMSRKFAFIEYFKGYISRFHLKYIKILFMLNNTASQATPHPPDFRL